MEFMIYFKILGKVVLGNLMQKAHNSLCCFFLDSNLVLCTFHLVFKYSAKHFDVKEEMK